MKKFFDRVVNEAREKAIKKALIPRRICKKYKVTIKNGKAIISLR